VYVIQALCKCGQQKGKPIWRDARTECRGQEFPIQYKSRKYAESVARDLEVLWEPDVFRVIERKP